MLGMLVGIMKRVDAIAPALVTERRVGHDVVEGLEGVTVLELGSARMFPCMMSAAGLLCRIMVHPCQAAGGRVLLWRHR